LLCLVGVERVQKNYILKQTTLGFVFHWDEKMSCINVTNVQILDNPTQFTNPLQFEISFECICEELKEDLEWKVIYVGSAEDETYDQVLDSILLGPIKRGINKFVFQVDPPDITKIPKGDLLGVTVILLTCSYRSREFIRVGYYVNNEYSEQFPELRETPPEVPDLSIIIRNILAEKPRVTRFPIPWDEEDTIISNNNAEINNFPSNDIPNEDVQMVEWYPSRI